MPARFATTCAKQLDQEQAWSHLILIDLPHPSRTPESAATEFCLMSDFGCDLFRHDCPYMLL
jgi:hypothetical protein